MNIQALLGWQATLIGIGLLGLTNLNTVANLTQVSELKEELNQLNCQLHFPFMALQRDGAELLYGSIAGFNQSLLGLGGWLIQQTQTLLLGLSL